MGASKRKRRRKKRGRGAAIIILLLFIAASCYITYTALTAPERISVFNSDNAAPVFAEAAENEIENEEDGDMNIETYDEPNPYIQFSFYIPEKLQAYEIYASANPMLGAESVVWRVNAGLDRPFFESPATLTGPDPLLVNPYNRLPDDFRPSALETIDASGRQATPETINAFRVMREGALTGGFELSVQSAYRTIEYQKGLYERAGGDGSVARPGFSEHHTGRALDLWGPDGLLDENGATGAGRWVAENAYNYGFIIRYPDGYQGITGYIYEPWHITYVGIEIAKAMREEGIVVLEEYIAKRPNQFPASR